MDFHALGSQKEVISAINIQMEERQQFLFIKGKDISRGYMEAPMFARIKKSGQHQYLQIVENHRECPKTIQRVIATIGRMDYLEAKGDIETLIRSLSRFSEKVLLILSGKSEVHSAAKKIGPSLIFERLWRELGIGKIIQGLLGGRRFEFDVERAIFLTV